MNKLKAFFWSIIQSFTTILIFYLVWLVRTPAYSFIAALTFLVPYYALWLAILIVSLTLNGKAFRVIWIGSIRDDETFSKSNLPYALSFLLGSLAIFIIQYFII